jgi:hypothetical protein
MNMPDPTGPELLDALERLYAAVSLHEDIIYALQTGEASQKVNDMVNEVILAWGETPPDPIARLRSLLRTPEETAVLRAAVLMTQAQGEMMAWLGRLVAALPSELRAALTEEARRLTKEDKTDG